jgi:Icc-related predicted phosphoesterase
LKRINIVGDTHNHPALKKVLDNFDNVISLGDIAAIDTKEYFKHRGRYAKVWKAMKQKKDMDKEDYAWFKKLNIEGWLNQMKIIRSSKKSFKVVMGNSDLRMLTFFKECRNELRKLKKLGRFEIFTSSKLLNIGKIQVLVLPYKDGKFLLNNILRLLNRNKKLFVLGHCPPFNKWKKYYTEYSKALKKISDHYRKGFLYLHGHVHPKYSYVYSLDYLPKVKIIAPKANESKRGIGIDHHIVNINTEDGEIKIISLKKFNAIKLKKLPNKYYKKDHWNDFG